MKAIECLKNIPIPQLTLPTDAIIRITSSRICGSDLHFYHGRGVADPPITMGHEVVGIVHKLRDKVHDLALGDRVLVSGLFLEPELDGEDKILGEYVIFVAIFASFLLLLLQS